MAQSYLYRRHSLLVRITHWINVIALTALLMSGLQIFNEHPALYWGKSSYTGKPALFEVPNGFPWGKPSYTGKPAIYRSREQVPVLDHGSQRAVARDGAPLAFLLRVAVRHQRHRCYLAHSIASRHVQRDLTPTRERLARASGAPSRITCACVIRTAKRPGATTCCRSSPICS